MGESSRGGGQEAEETAVGVRGRSAAGEMGGFARMGYT